MASNKDIILHIDMDSFFASIEEGRKNFEGDPVVVCVYSGRSEDSGAVSTTNYKAREYGIKSAMPIKRAKSIAESAKEEKNVKFHFVPVDKEYYREVSDRIRNDVLENFSDEIEQGSIDEFYLDISESAESFRKAKEVGKNIQKEIRDRFDLTCSIGIGPNKLIAKIASDRDKPCGLTVVSNSEVKGFMYSLELEDVHGIGKKTVERLKELGIRSVKDLANADIKTLKEKFGDNLGPKLISKARGEGSTVVREKEQKQISRLTTLKENSLDYDYIEDYLEKLAQDLSEKLRKKEKAALSIILIGIDKNLETRTLSKSLDSSVNSKEAILELGKDLLRKYLKENYVEVRRIGLRVSNLEENRGQKSLGDF